MVKPRGAYLCSEISISENSTVVLIEPERGDNYIEMLDATVTFSSSRVDSAPDPFIILIERQTNGPD